MPKTSFSTGNYLSQPRRLIALFGYVFALLLVSKLILGEWVPSGEGRRLWVLAGIGLWFFSLISAPFFRPPRDSLANAVAVGLMLWTIDLSAVPELANEIGLFRWISFGLVVLVVLSAIAAMFTAYADPLEKPELAKSAKFSHRLSDSLGRGEVMFTPIALISIAGFYQGAPITQIWLAAVWVFLVAVKPIELFLRLITDFQNLRQSAQEAKFIGTIRRIDNPNVIRVALDLSATWDRNAVAIACLPNGNQVQIIPLFTHYQDSEIIGTGLIHGAPEVNLSDATVGHVYKTEAQVLPAEMIDELSGVPGGAELTGFVVEGATIPIIRFEASRNAGLVEGTLTFCRQGDQTIFYQVLGAETAEEIFERNPSGKHVVSAAQLGVLDVEKGFVKYGWLPSMNTPVFVPKAAISDAKIEKKGDEFDVGKVPGSGLRGQKVATV